LTASYYQKVDVKTLFATEMQVDLSRGASIASVGYQYNFRSAIFRGQLTTHGEVSGMLEQDIFPGLLGVQFNAALDHWKGDVKFGMGMTFNS